MNGIPQVRAVSGVAGEALLLRKRDQDREEAGTISRAVRDIGHADDRRPHSPLGEVDNGGFHDIGNPEGALVFIADGKGRVLLDGRPAYFPDEPMLPAATSGFPLPASASPYTSMTGSSAADTAPIPPNGSRSCLSATWMTPSESAAASMSPSRSWRSPRRTFAPSADTAAAAVSDRARPVTSCPAAMSSG